MLVNVPPSHHHNRPPQSSVNLAEPATGTILVPVAVLWLVGLYLDTYWSCGTQSVWLNRRRQVPVSPVLQLKLHS